jgi:hypothetical protein
MMEKRFAKREQLKQLSASELEAMAIELYNEKRWSGGESLRQILECRKYKMNENFVFTPEVIEKLLWIDREIKHCVNQLQKNGEQIARNLEEMIKDKDSFFNDYEVDVAITPQIIEWSDYYEEECETEDEIFGVIDCNNRESPYHATTKSINLRCLGPDDVYFEEVECRCICCVRNTEFEKYHVGWIMHELLDDTCWSLPDIIRINKIDYVICVKYQHYYPVNRHIIGPYSVQ